MVNSEDFGEDFVVKQQDSVVAAPLSAIAEAFEDLAKWLKVKRVEHEDLPLNTFCHACSFISVLFYSLGFAFKFAELEYVAKLHTLVEASRTYDTLQDILDLDIATDTVKTSGSYSRNLRRVRQGLGLIKAIFEQFVATDDTSLKDVASTAYAQSCAPYHSWAVRTAVYAGMYTLPTRDQLLAKLNETMEDLFKVYQFMHIVCLDRLEIRFHIVEVMVINLPPVFGPSCMRQKLAPRTVQRPSPTPAVMVRLRSTNTKKIQFTQRLPLGSELHMGKECCCFRDLDHLHRPPTSHSIFGNLMIYKPSLTNDRFMFEHDESLRADLYDSFFWLHQSAEKKMRRYIDASLPVIEYIDELYLSRNIILDWQIKHK
ncbi:hypothetical protein Lal_00000370 [Lupinus albus]|nr:hypothetical protein Lal_00000370 [Lupinus albus]